MIVKNKDKLLNRLDKLAGLLDNFIEIPHTKIKIGIDSIIGLIPGIGDTLSLLFSFYIIFDAIRLKLPKNSILKMFLNVCIDWLIGSIPILGDIFDVVWKANLRNVQMIKEELNKDLYMLESK